MPDEVGILSPSPVSEQAEDGGTGVQPGIALCLSGGGYRAMLFHVGTLWRLNELGYLPKLDRVSSVSGGSITAATLGHHWGQLAIGDDGVAAGFKEHVVEPLREMARHTIDASSVVGGILAPGKSIGDMVSRAYRDHLFGHDTLQSLPDQPRFVINATNLQTGSLWRFSKPYMADYQIGMYRTPAIELAVAVAASSAFPPILSPQRITLDADGWAPEGRGDLFMAPYTTNVVLADGGVYDNLGLETAWKAYDTILVSDGGGHMGPEPTIHSDWVHQGLRVNSVIDNQVRSLRKRNTIAGFIASRQATPGPEARKGAYWGIRTNIADYPVVNSAVPCPVASTTQLAAVKTRLEKMPDQLQERLINWGYAVCDAAMGSYVTTGSTPASAFPFAGGVG